MTTPGWFIDYINDVLSSNRTDKIYSTQNATSKNKNGNRVSKTYITIISVEIILVIIGRGVIIP